MKLCRGCLTEKPLSDFSPAKRGRDGRAYYCRPCAAAKRRDYYTSRRAQPGFLADQAARQAAYLRTNADQAKRDRQRALAWAKAHAEVVRERNARWRLNNPDRARAHSAAYRKAHPDTGRAAVQRRRARLAEAPQSDFTAAQWREVLEEFQSLCAYCLRADVPLQMDHLQPLSRGGSHTKSNIVPACATCNNSKGSLELLHFALRSEVS